MLPVDPMLAKLRKRRIWTILHLLLLPVGIILIVIGGTSSSSSFGRELLWGGLFSVLASAGIFFQERFLRRIQHRRQEAAFGDQMLIAAEQPAPDSASLQLPTTIKLRLSKRFVLIGVVEVLVVVLVGGYLAYPLTRSHFSSGLFIVIGLALALFFIMMGVAFAMISRQLSQQLDITEDGLTSRYMGTVSSIRWGEATLFATYAAFGAQKSKAVSTYELSGANSMVKWTWYKYKGKNSFMSIRPTIPIDEYTRQMQALLSLVVARTGLPLYDLRKGKPGGGPKE